MIKEGLVDPSSSDTEEHYIWIGKERFQEVRDKRKRDRSPSSGSSMDVEDSKSSDGTEEFISTWGSWGLKAREDHKAQERVRREKKEKVKRDLIKCMELERKLIRAGAQSQYGELAGKRSKAEQEGNKEEAEAIGRWIKLMRKPDGAGEPEEVKDRQKGFSTKWLDVEKTGG